MGWRETLAAGFAAARYNEVQCVNISGMAAGYLLDMPATDRIALARELLAGTGRVVARDVGEKPKQCVPFIVSRGQPPRMIPVESASTGWNSCRAAMMGDDK